ncbi:hypothetical protein [Arthrobacter sp. KNU40]|uniref:hypothetical protein n=1 Tax=Arthrobacter sp. KNU40 TaxID=3447965 RepID=UPI003F62714B
MNRLDSVLADMERSAADLRRAWDGTNEAWRDSRRTQTAVELIDPTLELAKDTAATLRAITDQVLRATASLRLP